ncbi:vitamin K epoxide reductase family protein [Pedobacter sp. PWIIR3]
MTLKSLSNLVYKLVNELKFPVSHSSIYGELEKHPDQFSFLGISEVLSGFQITNGAYNLESYELDNEMCPFISHISRNGGEFILVREIINDKVTISSENSKKEVLSKSSFDQYFTGSILVVDEESEAVEDEYEINKRRDIVHSLRYPYIISSFAIILLLILFQNLEYVYSFSFSVIGWTIVKLMGLVVSILLLIQSIDTNNSFIKKICGGEKTDCKSILASKAAKLTEEISWSEIGFFYFISTFLIILFYANSTAVLQILALINILALPYTFYSIYYQYFVAKKWCVLCVSTQVILWCEFLFSFKVFSESFSFPSASDLIGVIILFLVPTTIWILIKPFLKTKQYVVAARNSLNSFKRNPAIFRSALLAQERFAEPDEEFAVIFGANEPKNIITIVSSPSCSACRRSHKTIEKWLHSDETLQVRFVFSLLGDPSDSENYHVGERIISLKLEQADIARKALTNWYSKEGQNFNSWSEKFPLLGFVYPDPLLMKQENWCRSTKVIFTPTILVNGFKLPEPYQLEDIRYLI